MSISSVCLSETENRADAGGMVPLDANIRSCCVMCCNAAPGVAGVTGGGSGGVLGSSSGVLGHSRAKCLAMIGMGGGIFARLLTLDGREEVLSRSVRLDGLVVGLLDSWRPSDVRSN